MPMVGSASTDVQQQEREALRARSGWRSCSLRPTCAPSCLVCACLRNLLCVRMLQVFEAAGRSPAANVALLEQMLLTRAEMARMVGCDSYSRYKAWGARWGTGGKGRGGRRAWREGPRSLFSGTCGNSFKSWGRMGRDGQARGWQRLRLPACLLLPARLCLHLAASLPACLCLLLPARLSVCPHWRMTLMTCGCAHSTERQAHIHNTPCGCVLAQPASVPRAPLHAPDCKTLLPAAPHPYPLFFLLPPPPPAALPRTLQPFTLSSCSSRSKPSRLRTRRSRCGPHGG